MSCCVEMLLYSPASCGIEEVPSQTVKKDSSKINVNEYAGVEAHDGSQQNQVTDKHLGESVDKSTQTQFSEIDGMKLPSPAEIHQMQMTLTALLAREQRRLDHKLSLAHATESRTKVVNLVNKSHRSPAC